MTTFINGSVTEMSKAFTMTAPVTEPGNLTAALIDGINVTNSSLLLDQNNIVGSYYDGNKTATPDELTLPYAFTAVHYGLRSMGSCLTLFGNLLTIISVAHFESLRNTTSFFICSLAAADLLSTLITPIAITLELLGAYHPSYISLCLARVSLMALSASLNVSSILMIAVDRYIFIAHGLRYSLLVTSTRTFCVICIIWLGLTVEIGLLYTLGNWPEIGTTCSFSLFVTDMMFKYVLLPGFLILTLLTVSFYIAISCIAYEQGKKIAALRQPYNTHEATTNRQQKRIAKMMILVLGTYFMSYIPEIIVASLKSVYTDSLLLLVLEKVTVLIMWSNSWINPIIYAWNSTEFNRAFRKLLCLKVTNVASFNAP